MRIQLRVTEERQLLVELCLSVGGGLLAEGGGDEKQKGREEGAQLCHRDLRDSMIRRFVCREDSVGYRV
jgi:hypothetical protein